MIQEAKFGFSQEEEISFQEKCLYEQLLITIQQGIEKDDFFSVRSLAYKLNCQPCLIHRYLTQHLHLVFKHTRWIPHILNFAHKIEGQELSFQVLEKSKHNGYRNIITGYQSWFAYHYAPKGCWVLQDEQAPVFSNSRIFNRKI